MNLMHQLIPLNLACFTGSVEQPGFFCAFVLFCFGLVFYCLISSIVYVDLRRKLLAEHFLKVVID